MAERRIGIIMHGMNQHLIRSILAIRAQGGVELADGTKIVPEPLLVGRNPAKLETLAAAHGLDRFALDLDAALEDPDYEIFFDAASTRLRGGPSPPASTSTARSRSPRPSRRRSQCIAPRKTPASGKAWSRTSSGCRGC
jgi:hypothetical protein